LYLIAIGIGVTVMLRVQDARPAGLQGDVGLAVLAIVGIITAVSIFLSASIFTIGYVNRDSRRRGMNSALWTWFVLLMLPTSVGIIGFVIYLLMREPLPYPCPRCNNLVGARFNFCPNCNAICIRPARTAKRKLRRPTNSARIARTI